jgi:ADP-ribosylglycohydrolase
MHRTDQIAGSLVGGAIGDAFGGPYEGSAPPVRINDEAEWRLSDDTQLTLATCEAVVAAGRVDPEVIGARMAEWFKARRLSGLGASTHKALAELAAGGHWALVGRKGEMAAGNGAAMRVAPLAFLLDPTDPDHRRTLRDVCRITHHHEEAYAGALAIVAPVRFAWEGTWAGEPGFIPRTVELLPDCRVRDRLKKLTTLDPHLPPSDVAKHTGNSGYVVESVPLALYGAQQVRSLGFQQMIEGLVAAGGDTDTIASMAGQVAGAVIGYGSLPKTMLDRLPDGQMVSRIAGRFAEFVKPTGTRD